MIHQITVQLPDINILLNDDIVKHLKLCVVNLNKIDIDIEIDNLFDFIILENAYKICNLLVPWKFWSLRDCRTVYDLANTKLSSIGETKHNSLDDCYNQILCLRKSLKKLKLVK